MQRRAHRGAGNAFMRAGVAKTEEIQLIGATPCLGGRIPVLANLVSLSARKKIPCSRAPGISRQPFGIVARIDACADRLGLICQIP
jgi:hypothetical protein